MGGGGGRRNSPDPQQEEVKRKEKEEERTKFPQTSSQFPRNEEGARAEEWRCLCAGSAIYISSQHSHPNLGRERGKGVAGRGERRERKARGCQRDALKATSSRQYTHHFAPRDARTMPAINAVFAISPREEARDTFRSRRATTDISPLVRQYLSSLLHSPPLAPPSSPSVSPSALASLALPPAFPGRLDLA